MTGSLELSRWRAAPRGVGYRRGVIVASGLRQLFRLRFFQLLLAVSWSAGFALAVLGFGFSQSIADGGWVETLARHIGPRAQAASSVLAGFILLYPDVCIGGFYTLLFWAHSFVALWFSLVALTALVPRLVALDRSSRALLVYLSRPLTSTDYLLGKLGIVAGVLALVWTGPLLFGWLLGIVFAPNLDFAAWSLEPLGRALLFNLVALVVLSAIALGVSSLVRSARHTVILWLGLWLGLGFFNIDRKAPVWLQRASFTQNLTEVRAGLLRPDAALRAAAEELPLASRQLSDNLARAGTRAETRDFAGALAGLSAFVALGAFAFLRRIRPE